MIRLLYISTARTILTATEIDNVLRISRRNNKAVDVTGLLIIGMSANRSSLSAP